MNIKWLEICIGCEGRTICIVTALQDFLQNIYFGTFQRVTSLDTNEY